jgi:hypothetical protein
MVLLKKCRPAVVAIAFLSPLLWLAGCDKPDNDNPLFPLAEGMRWTYRIEISYDAPEPYVDRSTITMSNLGKVDLNGVETWRRRSDYGNDYWLKIDDKGVHRIASRTPNDKVAVLDRAPRTVIPAKLSKEDRWTTTTSPYFLKRRNEWPQEFKYVDRFRDLTMSYAVEATDQKVSTPAGDFSGCVVIKGVTPLHIWHEREMTYKEAPMVNLEWYCPNVGLVQLERTEPTTARFFQGGVMRMTLLSYKSL